MGENETIAVRKEFDIVTARMRARELARAMGFDLVDQARIALATSSAVRALGIDGTPQNQITITLTYLGTRERSGVQGVKVICAKANTAMGDLSLSAFSSTRRMVDELAIEALPPGDVQVTLIKWLDDENSQTVGLNRPCQLARAQ